MDAKLGMSPMEIRNALLKADLNQSAIARALNINPATVSLVIDGKGVSGRVHAAIAEAIGMDKARIWPERYMVQGPPPKAGRQYKTWNRKAA